MSWLIWRQHRGELAVALGLLAGLGVLLLLHGVPMHEAYERGGIEACRALLLTAGDASHCEDAVLAFENQHSFLPAQFTTWLPLSPALVGMLIGVPLLAREYEQGTWQLAWTQGVTRARWLATKLTVVLGAVLACTVTFAAALSWWIAPTAPEPFTSEVFNHTPLVFPAYVLTAVAIGVLAGAVVKRTLVAAAIVVPSYLAVRLPIEFWLRPSFREPLTSADPSVASQGWIIQDAEAGGPAGGGPLRFPEPVRYHPADRFWDFQLIETTILLGITAVLVVVAWRVVVGRRTSAPSAAVQPELVPS